MARTPGAWLAAAALLLLVACGGGSSGGGDIPLPVTAPPTAIAYTESAAAYPPGVRIADNVPTVTGGTPTAWAVQPPLPDGLRLDPATGVISGSTTRALAPTTTYEVTASNAGGSTSTELELTVGVFESLADGFVAELVHDGLATPSRIACAPDGRIFFNELGTGDTRVLRADSTLQPTPFAHEDVVVGGHRGLLGIALHPDFMTNGWVYVLACVVGQGGNDDRIQVKRYTAADIAGVWTGTNETVIVDDLPLGGINNGGSLVFGLESPSPRLYVSIGDNDDPATAQVIGGKAGRILRYTDTGAIPADNPDPSDPTFCLGLRNTFGMAVQPTTGDLWGGDNGPAANDELNYLRAGRNFGWGYTGPPLGPTQQGVIVTTWVDVIVPTGLAWHDGTGWGDAYADNLFLTSYTEEEILRFELSGLAFLDIDAVSTFAAFRPNAIENKPLDIQRAPNGSLLISTFTAIYRISAAP